MLLLSINHLSCVDQCVKPRINMLSERSVCLVCHQYSGQYPQEIVSEFTALGGFKFYLHCEFGSTP